MVKIMTDSTSDLSEELMQRFAIGLIPLHILLGEEEYRDRTEITPAEIFAWSDAHKTTPKTSAVSMEDVLDVFRPVLDAGDEIVVFTISEDMSTTVNVMRMAAEELGAADRVTVIDSRNLSTGIGLLVCEAAEMAQEGKSREEIEKEILRLIPKVRASFVIDTLEYLYRGGRCSGVAALAGSVLKLHPKIVVADGKMLVEKKYRGKIGKVIMDYATDMEEAYRQARKRRVFVTHTLTGANDAAPVVEYLRSLQIFDEICETKAGGVVSSHCGPGTLGVLFIEEEVRD